VDQCGKRIDSIHATAVISLAVIMIVTENRLLETYIEFSFKYLTLLGLYTEHFCQIGKTGRELVCQNWH
jgi:hypothetical protein